MQFLLHHLAMESARRAPDSVAVLTDSDSLTYAELERRSSQLANALLAAGHCRGDRIGLYMDKGTAAYVALQAVLKAGCAYVPLDPNAPVERLAYIVDDCQIRCLLSTASKLRSCEALAQSVDALERVVVAGAAGLQESEGSTFVEWEQFCEGQSSELPTLGTIETDLAYILYTSGSTGRPKGVMISHLNSLTFVRWSFEEIGVVAEDRVSGHAPLHFDLSIFDVFTTWMAGATLLPVPPTASLFPRRLAEWIGTQKITVWYSVPSILSMMMQAAELSRTDFEHLRLILFAGEVFPARFLKAWIELLPEVVFYNLYGPTETNVITYYRVVESDAERSTPVPIGVACANTDVYLLAEDASIVEEPGVEGILYARGSGIAQGYWGDEAKTQASFLGNQRLDYLADRVYNTGDVVRLDDEGNFIFIGRRDHMVKSRGYRIELGEIEAALYDHELVNEAAVVPEPDEMIGNRLLAFVVAESPDVTAAELRAAIGKRLPKYMVPDSVEFRSSLPKTSTGKVDRNALLASLQQPVTSSGS